MTDTLTGILLVLSLVNLVLLLVLLLRPPRALAHSLRKALEEDLKEGRRVLEEGLKEGRRSTEDDLREGRREAAETARHLREEVAGGLQKLGDTLSNTQTNAGKLQQEQLAAFAAQLKELHEANARALESVRATLDDRVKELQAQNERKLDEMRRTVDEKLQGTLEKRLGESFKLVSDRLERVQRGLGEMQELATGVGDLKRVLTNVKTRGTWAEVQLGAILEQFLAPGQFDRNVRTREGSLEVVEFAVRLPGRPDDPESRVWLPIDSKFPQEDWLRLQEAAERGDADSVQKASESLARTLRSEAQKIQEKYLAPPSTTDFGIMFLATEGLYAEALRHPGLAAELQQRHRIVLAGPTTLAAILSSLRMGFQTLAIEKRASEVWEVLGAVKAEFGKLGEVLARVKKQIHTAGRTLDQAETRSRVMARKLRSVEQLPGDEARTLLSLPSSVEEGIPEPSPEG